MRTVAAIRTAFGALRDSMRDAARFHRRRLRLAAWRPKRRAIGRRVLMVATDYPYDHGLHSLLIRMREAFRDVRVRVFGPAERPRSPTSSAGERLWAAVERWRPEAVVNCGMVLYPSEIETLSERGMRLIAVNMGAHSFYCSGPPVTQREAMDALRRHAAYLVSHAAHVPRLRAEGARAEEFPFWCDPRWFRPIPVRERWDVLFFGDVKTPLNSGREALLRRVAASFRLAIAAPEDPNVPGAEYLGSTCHPLVLNRWINAARIVLGSDRLGDPQALNRVPGQYLFYDDAFFVRARTFLAMGAGACYLVERHPAVERLFRDGEDLVLWDSEEDLLEKIRRLLGDDARRRRIGANARARVEREHSTFARIERLRALAAGGDPCP